MYYGRALTGGPSSAALIANGTKACEEFCAANSETFSEYIDNNNPGDFSSCCACGVNNCFSSNRVGAGTSAYINGVMGVKPSVLVGLVAAAAGVLSLVY